MKFSRRKWGVVAAVAMTLTTQAALAQSASTKPLQIIVGGAAGGIDNPIRAMAPALSQMLGQPVVVDNKPGANGLIAAQIVARSEADGNTLLYTTVSTMVLAPLLQKQAVDPTRQLQPVATIYESFQVLAVASKVPVKSVEELVAYAKANPGKLNYVSSGNGSLFHLQGEVFKQRAGVDMTHVPQKALSPAVQDLVGGHVDLGFLSFNAIRPHIATGKVRVLAVMSPQRLSYAKDIPSIVEALPDFPLIPSWIGVAVPNGTPAARVQQLHRALVDALGSKDVQELLQREGNQPGGKPGDVLANDIRNESRIAERVIKAAGIVGD
jgi:tripartite-type tricarboxylate transporter receptor subunit TctC